MDYEFVCGRRRNSKLLYSISEQQLYLTRSVYKNTSFYCCKEKNCRARVFLLDNVLSKHSDFIQHNRGDQKELYEELKALNKIKNGCLDISSVGKKNAMTGIRDIYRSISYTSPEATKNIEFEKIQRGLQYISSKVYISSPKSPAEVQHAFQKEEVFKNFGLTRHNEGNDTLFFKVCYEEKDFSYCMFVSDKCVSLIQENIPNNASRKVLIDATFAVVPLGCFKQLLIMCIEYIEMIFPFAFVLMDKKSSKSYTHIFKYLNENILNLDGATFITDYEQSLRKSVNTVFKNSKLFGCWFHYSQAVRRQITIKYKGLAKFIIENKKASLEYHKILSLPLLPPCYILSSFDAIKKDIENIDPHFKFAQFFEYFKKQWLQKIRPEGMSVADTLTRTTSALEAYNGVLGRIIPKQANFFKFVQVLQNEEYIKSRDFEQFTRSGGSFGKTKRKKAYADKGEKIKKAVEELRRGIITSTEFLNRMGFPARNICVDMVPDDDLFEGISYLEEEIDEEEFITPEETSNNLIKLCIVCLLEEPNILFLPCKHMRVCAQCSVKLQEQTNNAQQFSCPVCRQLVSQTINVFV